jgi:type IV secretory pathway VirB9-like protein
MKRPTKFVIIPLLLALLTAGRPLAAQTSKPRSAAPPAGSGASRKAAASTLPVQAAAKVIQYSEQDVPQILTQLRYSTLIVLPKDEVILDFVCGDKDLWVVEGGGHNFAYVKPAKEAAHTNLNLITASGNVYSFALREITGSSETRPDLKVFVELVSPAMAEAASAPRRFVPVRELEDYRQQAQLAREEAREVKAASQARIDAALSQFMKNLRFAYEFEAGKKPFRVRAMAHDERFTYIQATPEETPTLYELRDGKPNLVNFDYEDGVYVVPKVLERGYLQVGKKKLAFKREE